MLSSAMRPVAYIWITSMPPRPQPPPTMKLYGQCPPLRRSTTCCKVSVSTAPGAADSVPTTPEPAASGDASMPLSPWYTPKDGLVCPMLESSAISLPFSTFHFLLTVQYKLFIPPQFAFMPRSRSPTIHLVDTYLCLASRIRELRIERSSPLDSSRTRSICSTASP
ncbi:hypothetical protein BJV78DRAFT_1227796 [Lactifluus subvellereus]|nr:hypothetical protein BJV78DRAFT_1227796 [Lactifluus subvellereus]